MTGGTSALQGYRELKVSEGKLVGIKYYSVFSGVGLPMIELSLQAP